jgi:hypothetical protein
LLIAIQSGDWRFGRPRLDSTLRAHRHLRTTVPANFSSLDFDTRLSNFEGLAGGWHSDYR